MVPAPPWCATAATRGKSAWWLTSPTTRQSGSASPSDSSAQPRETIARRPSARADSHHPAQALLGAHAPEPEVDGGLAGVEEPPKRGRELPLVGHDPRA